MTDPKTTFLVNATIVKADLQSLADATSGAQSNFSNLTESVISRWQSEGVLSESDAAAVRQNMPKVGASAQPINVQAIVDMIAAMEQIVQGLGSSFSLSEVSTQPASTTATGSPGQFYIQGVSAFWLCVRTNFWVKLAML